MSAHANTFQLLCVWTGWGGLFLSPRSSSFFCPPGRRLKSAVFDWGMFFFAGGAGPGDFYSHSGRRLKSAGLDGGRRFFAAGPAGDRDLP